MAKDTFELSSSLVKGVQIKEAQAQYSDYKNYRGEYLEYSISPLYQRYIGSTVTVAFNGNFRKFPVDGTTFPISRGHYNSLMKYLRHIDRQIKIQNQNTKFMGNNVSGDFKKM